MHKELRKFYRANLICKISATFANRLLVFNSHTENIGEGGIMVILEEKLHVSTPVDVELFLSAREFPLKCKGEVIWVKERSPVGIKPFLINTGIKFIELTDLQKEDIRNLVSNVIQQTQG
jgi:hypothetical protein